LGTSDLESGVILGVVHRISNLLQALLVKVWLVAQYYGELLDEHLEDIVVPYEVLKTLVDLVLGFRCRHTGGQRCLNGPIESFDVLEDFLGHDEGANVVVFGEEDYHLVIGHSDAHVGQVRLGDRKPNELTHHQMQVQR